MVFCFYELACLSASSQRKLLLSDPSQLTRGPGAGWEQPLSAANTLVILIDWYGNGRVLLSYGSSFRLTPTSEDAAVRGRVYLCIRVHPAGTIQQSRVCSDSASHDGASKTFEVLDTVFLLQVAF